MSKPLTFFMELVGGIMIIAGVIPPMKIGILSIGIILVLVGAVGIRKRLS